MEDNIFEAAGKQKRFVEKKTPAYESEKVTVKKTQDDKSYSELMKKDLEDQLSDIYQKGKEKNLNAKLLVNNAKDLTSKQLEKMEEEEKKLIDKINAIIPPGACLIKNAKSKEKLTQERKGKLRGARNNWIPMR